MKKSYYFLCLVLALAAACRRDDDVYTIGNKDGQVASSLFWIASVSAPQIEADTASTIAIIVKITPGADTLSHTITANTTFGSFVNDKTTMTLTANSLGEAKALLHSGKTGNATVTFTVKNLSVNTTVSFIPALPDDFTLTADKYTGDSTVTYNVTSTLFRNPGKGLISDPAKVYYSISPASPGNTLVIPAFVNTAVGVATAQVSNPYKIKGSFVVLAKTAKFGGDTLRKSINLIIK
jgi:hypothetical protein